MFDWTQRSAAAAPVGTNVTITLLHMSKNPIQVFFVSVRLQVFWQKFTLAPSMYFRTRWPLKAPAFCGCYTFSMGAKMLGAINEKKLSF